MMIAFRLSLCMYYMCMLSGLLMNPQATQELMVPRYFLRTRNQVIEYSCAYHPVPAPSAGFSAGVFAGRGQTTLNPPPQASLALSAFLQQHSKLLAGFHT